MPKRRNVILGLGSLAFGSGALTSMASFTGSLAEPDGDFRVIADSQLRVRSARGGAPNYEPIVTDYNNQSSDHYELGDDDVNITDNGFSSDYSTFKDDNLNKLIDGFGQPKALGAEINQKSNEELAIRLGVSNRINESIAPLLEITNNSSTEHKVAIHYAESNGSGGISSGKPSNTGGYGGDVYYNENSEDYKYSDSNTVSRQLVQDVYKFKLDSNDYGTSSYNNVGSLDTTENDAVDGDGKLISPDPGSDGSTNPDESSNYAYLSGGDTIFVKLDILTKNNVGEVNDIIGEINSAAAGGGSQSPWATNDTVDLLDTIRVEAINMS